ncbi:MAG: RICIN domain-containing protein, partial [Pseudomonadales bacterium]|nr:RICIN domain-containing protein [Pseudomonadales bacterium]
GDLIFDDVDNCVSDANTTQDDWNSNGIGDVCDDSDSDSVIDDVDNCRADANPGQEDYDNDGIGNVCEAGGFGYYFYNPVSNLCIETISTSDVDARACVLNTPDNQAFTVTVSNVAGSYTLASQSTTECIVWDNNLGTDDVDTTGCNPGSDLQQWVFTETAVGSGQYKMSPRDNSECLEVDGGNLEGVSCGTTRADWEIYDRDTHIQIDPNTL